jgi:hypothetical protein
MTNEWVPQIGDSVIVRDPDQFVSPLDKKLLGRSGTVLRVWTPLFASRPRVAVLFGKRNGRGKEFQHSFSVSDLMPWPKEGADR